MPPKRTSRKIDTTVGQTFQDFESRFALVTKTRANIWLTSAVVLFLIGFVVGIAYLADPNAFLKGSLNSNDSSASFLRSGQLLTPQLNSAGIMSYGSQVNSNGQVVQQTQNSNETYSDDTGNPTDTSSNQAVLTVTPDSRGAQVAGGAASTVLVTTYQVNWDSKLPPGNQCGIYRTVRNATTWQRDGLVGSTETKFYASDVSGIISLKCGGQNYEDRQTLANCRITPGTTTGDRGTASCDGGPSSCSRAPATISTIPAQTVTDGQSKSFQINITNRSGCQTGISIYQRPLDGSSGAWNFAANNESPDYVTPAAGGTAKSVITLSPYDYFPSASTTQTKTIQYEVLTLQRVENNDGSYSFPCNLKSSATFPVTINKPNPDPQPAQERVVAGLVSPPQCDVTRTSPSSPATYSGPDDGSQDDSARLAAEAQAAAEGQRVRGGIIPIIRNTGIFRAACKAVYGPSSPKCNPPPQP
jgi:hypothetical protein